MADIESLLKEKRSFKPSAEFTKQANWNRRTVAEYRKLAAKHHSELDGEIEALRQQHDHGREYVSEMANALDGYSRGKDAQVTIMLENLSPYVTMLRHHILREDRVFYPLVQEVLTQEEMDDLAELYTKEDERHGTVEAMQALVRDIKGAL